MSWRIQFQKIVIYHLEAINSYHCPLLLDTNPIDTYALRPFRFEAAWKRDERSHRVIKDAWKEEHSGTACNKLYQKQKSTQMALRKWNKEVFGHYQSRIKVLTSQIESIQELERTEANAIVKALLQSKLNEWIFRNEMIWRQKSRECWLKEGDRNSKFFHLSTIVRRRRNNIDSIKTDDGADC